MKLIVSIDLLVGFLALGWEIVKLGDSECCIKHSQRDPLFPCQDCGTGIAEARYTKYAGNCTQCWREEVLH
jgi:hypothetical protein